MLFNSNVFLYLFFPFVLIGYYVIHGVCRLLKRDSLTVKNVFLLLCSIGFYVYGNGRLALLLVFTIVFAYVIARLIDGGRRKALLALSVAVFVLLLVFFKYFGAVYTAVCSLLRPGSESAALDILLPIGISFYMFRAISYIADVYRKKTPAQKNFIKFSLYLSFFPLLTAGPVVRYEDMSPELGSRKETFGDIYCGICRFSIGLAKKVLVADVIGAAVDKIFAVDAGTLSAPLAWTGAILYTMQIFYDLSGYTDMATGIARVFGFKFRENFLMPYTAKNLTGFWSGWFVSLTSFFRDYLFIPLTGDKHGKARTYICIIAVFLLYGVWHGAALTFAAWGLYHGIIMASERFLKQRFKFEMKGVIGQIVTFLLVMLGWTLLRSASLPDFFKYLASMFGFGDTSGFRFYTYLYYADPQVVATGAAGLLLALLPFRRIREKLTGSAVYGICALLLLILSILFLTGSVSGPFIYYRF